MSIAEEVEEWVEKKPYIKESMAKEIVNYSALSREIQKDVDGGFSAVKMALRRLTEDLKDRRRKQRRDIGKVMEGTSIELENNIQVCKSESNPGGKVVSKTENGYTAMQNSDEECMGSAIEDQVMITLKSPETLENTPGVMAYALSILASRDINITELVSCREDTHIVIHEDDATEAFKLLNEKL